MRRRVFRWTVALVSSITLAIGAMAIMWRPDQRVVALANALKTVAGELRPDTEVVVDLPHRKTGEVLVLVLGGYVGHLPLGHGFRSSAEADIKSITRNENFGWHLFIVLADEYRVRSRSGLSACYASSKKAEAIVIPSEARQLVLSCEAPAPDLCSHIENACTAVIKAVR